MINIDDLQKFIAEAEREFGKNIAVLASGSKTLDVAVIPTGIENIDKALGIGGIPRGRITEIVGHAGVAKTTLCLHTVVQAQKMGVGCLYVDMEHALDPKRMAHLGVDLDRLIISQPDTAEQALELIEMGMNSGMGLVIVDSVAALIPQTEVEKGYGDSVMGVHAKLMSQAMRKLVSPCHKNNTALVFINQYRSGFSSYGATKVPTGGVALKFYSSLRIEMSVIGKRKSGDEWLADKGKMVVLKNKLATPHTVTTYEIGKDGIDGTSELIDVLISEGKIEKAGAWFKVDGVAVAKGKTGLMEKLKDKAFREKLGLTS